MVIEVLQNKPYYKGQEIKVGSVFKFNTRKYNVEITHPRLEMTLKKEEVVGPARLEFTKRCKQPSFSRDQQSFRLKKSVFSHNSVIITLLEVFFARELQVIYDQVNL